MIAPLPRKQSLEDLAESLLICRPAEMVDKLGPYAEAGVDRVILNPNFGASQSGDPGEPAVLRRGGHAPLHPAATKTAEAAE